MFFKNILFVCLFLILCPNILQAQDICENLDDAINRSSILMSIIYADSFQDFREGSEIRDFNRNIKINNELLKIQLNLQIMVQKKCAIRSRPVWVVEYMDDAMACQSARKRKGYDPSSDPEECDMSKWKRKKVPRCFMWVA